MDQLWWGLVRAEAASNFADVFFHVYVVVGVPPHTDIEVIDTAFAGQTDDGEACAAAVDESVSNDDVAVKATTTTNVLSAGDAFTTYNSVGAVAVHCSRTCGGAT